MNKKELRKIYKQKRADLSNQEREELSIQISKQFFNHFAQHKDISIFLPIDRFHEINTWHIINHSQSTFYLPVVREDELVHIRYEGLVQLKKSDWGILEPTYGEKVHPSTFDLVLVPLLAVDQIGYRVGYGKGYYDSFLAECNDKCLFVGLSFFDPIEAIADAWEKDIKLHAVVTPSGLIRF